MSTGLQHHCFCRRCLSTYMAAACVLVQHNRCSGTSCNSSLTACSSHRKETVHLGLCAPHLHVQLLLHDGKKIQACCSACYARNRPSTEGCTSLLSSSGTPDRVEGSHIRWGCVSDPNCDPSWGCWAPWRSGGGCVRAGLRLSAAASRRCTTTSG